MNLQIQEAKAEDIPLIVKAENEYFQNFTTDEKVKEDLANPLLKIYLLVNQNVYGYINLWIDIDKVQINSLVIIKEYRNQGYGTKLLQSILTKVTKEGVKEVSLEVRPTNLAAITLYQKLGFKAISIRKNYYNDGEDAILMYLKLGSD